MDPAFPAVHASALVETLVRFADVLGTAAALPGLAAIEFAWHVRCVECLALPVSDDSCAAAACIPELHVVCAGEFASGT